MNDQINTKSTDLDFSKPFLFKKNDIRLIQIQPTLRCNLKCKHCYSESNPDRKGEIPFKKFENFFNQAFDFGYNYIGVSGGEPLLWNDLEFFIEYARKKGFSTSITTNGTLLNEINISRINGVGIVAVSVDGPPKDHNSIRGTSNAFRLMKQGLSNLRKAKIPFSITFTLTKYNSNKLDWLYDFAVEEGAIGINVHPLLNFGAANKNLSDSVPDSYEFKIASWLLALLIQVNKRSIPAVTFDIVHRKWIEESNWLLLLFKNKELNNVPFSDLVPSIIVEPDGCISPFIYGFPRQFSLGDIDLVSLESVAGKWIENCAPGVVKILRTTIERLEKENVEYLDLFGEMLKTATVNQ